MASKSIEKPTGDAGKPGRMNPDDQFTFLISCIRHSVNGKIDFENVASECNVVSKGAAAKRYERMMKSHGIHQSQITPRDTSVKSTPRAKSTKPRAAGKKRKSDASDSADEDDAGTSYTPMTPSPTPKKKAAKKDSEEEPKIDFVPINKIKKETAEEDAEEDMEDVVKEDVKEEVITGIKEEDGSKESA